LVFVKKIILIIFFISCYSALQSQQYWIKQNTPVTKKLAVCSFVDSLWGWAAGDSGTIIRTTNGGSNWTIQQSNTPENINSVFFLNYNLGWALALVVSDNPENNFGTVILKTTNGGIHWDTSFYPEVSTFLFCVLFLDSLNGWMGGYPNPILHTTNGGQNWFPAYIDTTGPTSLPVRHITFYNKKFGVACGGIPELVGHVYVTTDYGNTWKGKGVAPEPLNSTFIFDSLNVVGLGGGPDEGPSIVSTSNSGSNWKLVALPYWGIPFACSFRTRLEGWSPMGYVPAFLKTDDGGITWGQKNTPDSAQLFDIKFTDYRNGFCVGDSGVVYKFNYAAVNISKIGTNIPSSYKLFQNFPNPFNPATKIKFDLKEDGRLKKEDVKLVIYDITGREIQTLVNEQLSPGTYEITFNGSNLSSGIYFYRLTSENYSQTMKMLLIK